MDLALLYFVAVAFACGMVAESLRRTVKAENERQRWLYIVGGVFIGGLFPLWMPLLMAMVPG